MWALCVSLESNLEKIILIKDTSKAYPDEQFDWTENWWFFENLLSFGDGIQNEVNAEIGEKHPLWRYEPIAIAKSNDSDDVIVRLNDGRYASVHLVWHGKIDQFPEKFPDSKIIGDSAALQNFLLGN